MFALFAGLSAGAGAFGANGTAAFLIAG